jgi:hypothetical protein
MPVGENGRKSMKMGNSKLIENAFQCHGPSQAEIRAFDVLNLESGE